LLLSKSLLNLGQLSAHLLVVNSRLQVKQQIMNAIIKMIRHEGFRCFYQGMRTKIVQSVFAASVLFMVKKDHVKEFVVLANKSMVKSVVIFVIGAFAKLGATVCTSVGCEVKASSKAADRGNVSLRYLGTVDAIIKMIRHEGFRCFYQGMRTKIVQSVFAASVLFMVKEELVKVFAVLANKSMVKSIAVDIK
ncbi:hypothetical protein T459_09247, partial [Capsicum annuum]